jgi:hypothetical protein
MMMRQQDMSDPNAAELYLLGLLTCTHFFFFHGISAALVVTLSTDGRLRTPYWQLTRRGSVVRLCNILASAVQYTYFDVLSTCV